MADVVDLNSIAERRPGSSPGPRTISDRELIAAVEGLSLVYEKGGRGQEDDCVRLTIPQARQLAALAWRGLPRREAN